MKAVQHIGIAIFLIGFGIFISLPFLGNFKLDQKSFEELMVYQGINSEIFIKYLQAAIVDKDFSGITPLSSLVAAVTENAHSIHT